MSKKVTVEYKCDAEFCSQRVDLTAKYWTPVIAYFGAGLTFYPWTEERANGKEALHFHDDGCATTYLTNWLEGQKPKSVPVAPAKYVDPIPAIITNAGTEEGIL